MPNKYPPNCITVMDKIDLSSNELDFQDYQHVNTCTNCHSYYKINQKLVSELKQCCAVDIPEGLKSRLIQQIEHYDSAQAVNDQYQYHQISSQSNNKHKNSALMPELMTCAACFTLVLLSLTLIIFNMSSMLADNVIKHLDHRHISQYETPPSASTVRKLLSPYDVNTESLIDHVIYANECIIDDLKSVHVVYSINKQHVSLVVMPVSTSPNDIGQVSGNGYQGMIVRVGNGTAVIASQDKTAVSDVYRKLKGSLTAI